MILLKHVVAANYTLETEIDSVNVQKVRIDTEDIWGPLIFLFAGVPLELIVLVGIRRLFRIFHHNIIVNHD